MIPFSVDLEILGPSEAVRDSENLKCQLSLNRDLTIQEIEWVGVSLPSSAILDLENHSALYQKFGSYRAVVILVISIKLNEVDEKTNDSAAGSKYRYKLISSK